MSEASITTCVVKKLVQRKALGGGVFKLLLITIVWELARRAVELQTEVTELRLMLGLPSSDP